MDTRVEEQLFKVDLPMIILCAENPHKDGLTISHAEMFYMGFNQKGKNFVGWATENMSTIEIIPCLSDNYAYIIRDEQTNKNIA